MKSFRILIIIIILFIITNRFSYGQLIIQKINDLDFGDVFIGYSAVVTDLSSNAAKFLLYQNSQPRMNLIVQFTLPNYLTNGHNSISIRFENYASWARSDIQTGRTYFNPYSPTLINNVRRNRYHYIWLGGQISSSTDILPGLYTGTIILTIEVL